MKISELFYSIQGEGKLVGVPSVFVRTSGCNLRCVWCDTPYASWNPAGQEQSVDQLVEQVLAFPARHIVLTGGEPMMFKELPELIGRLHAAGKHVTIETAGTLWLDLAAVGGIDLASVSPKLANSTPWQREGGRFAQRHEAHRFNREVLHRFATASEVHDIQWKFVVTDIRDVAEVQTVLEALPAVRPENVILMPEGVANEVLLERSQWLADVCKQYGYRFSPRLHVYLYGNKPGV